MGLHVQQSVCITLLIIIAAGCSGGETTSDILLINNVTVIDGTGSEPTGGLSVLIRNGRIVSLAPAGTIEVSESAQILDGAGKYLLPGFWDTHVHLSKIGPTALPLFVANGVTGVRDMGSDFAEVSLWREEIEVGLRIGPRIITPGPMVETAANVARMKSEGVVEPVERVRAAVTSVEHASVVIDSLAALGVDFIKVRTFESPEALAALAGATADAGLAFTGHTFGLMPGQIVAIGFHTVEHFLFPTLDELEPELRVEAFRELAEAGIAVVPTMTTWHESLTQPTDEVGEIAAGRGDPLDPRIRFISPSLRADWLEQAAERNEPAPFDINVLLESTIRNLREMQAAGVTILPGSDAAIVLIVPGFSLHDELSHLVADVGMTPHEAIIASTRQSAALFGLADEVGTIQPGKRADLVLLNANPLDDINNTRSIAGVIVNGRLFDRNELDAMLDDVAESVVR